MSGCYDKNTGVVLRDVPACGKGYYCPNVKAGDTSTDPTFCNPTAECAVQRLLGVYCQDALKNTSYFGAQGLYEPGMRQQTISKLLSRDY